jgi:ABC-2 type transport system permease protein
MIGQIKTVLVLTKSFTKRFFRDKVALFFTFLFPLLFLIIFGFIFGGNNTVSFNIAVINGSANEFATGFVKSIENNSVFKVKDVESFDKAKELVGRGELDAIIEITPEFGKSNAKNIPTGELKTFYDQGDSQLASTLEAVLQSTLNDINEQIQPRNDPLKLSLIPIQTSNLSAFDYTLPGLIGFSILSLGIFTMSEGFTGDKKSGALRRIKVAPISTWQLIVATAANRVFIGLLSIALLFVTSLVVFDFNMRGSYFNFIIFSIISLVCMFGFGMAIAGWAKDATQAAPLTQVIAVPMMFLSGVFFPVFLMPEWLQSITAYIPLTPIVDGLRLILTEGKTILDLGSQLSIIAAWTVIIYLIAFRIFRWE